MSEDAKRQIAFAVEQARMKYYPMYGVQPELDPEKFAELMYPHMGFEEDLQPAPEYPGEPETVTSTPEIGITAEITAPEDIVTFGEERAETHEFKSDRGGKCLTCGGSPDDERHADA